MTLQPPDLQNHEIAIQAVIGDDQFKVLEDPFFAFMGSTLFIQTNQHA